MAIPKGRRGATTRPPHISAQLAATSAAEATSIGAAAPKPPAAPPACAPALNAGAGSAAALPSAAGFGCVVNKTSERGRESGMKACVVEYRLWMCA